MIINCSYGVFTTVELAGGYCEAGLDCEPDCQYSYKKKDEKKVNKIFAITFGICEKCNNCIEDCNCKKGVINEEM